MSHDHSPTLAPEHGAGVATDSPTVSFDVQPLLLILVAACCVVTTVVIVKTYMERKNAKPMALGLFPAGSFVPATENGATADVKEAR